MRDSLVPGHRGHNGLAYWTSLAGKDVSIDAVVAIVGQILFASTGSELLRQRDRRYEE
jgi:hypothetical protein